MDLTTDTNVRNSAVYAGAQCYFTGLFSKGTVGFVGKEYCSFPSSFLHFTGCKCCGHLRETWPVTPPGHLPLSPSAVTFEAGDNFRNFDTVTREELSNVKGGGWS